MMASARTRPIPQRPAVRGARRAVPASVLEEKGRDILDPVAKLRFIRSSLYQYRHLGGFLRFVPLGLRQRFAYKGMSLEVLRQLWSIDPMGVQAPEEPSLLSRRWVLPAVVALLVAAATAGTFRAYTPGAEASAKPALAAAAPTLPVVAERLPPLPEGVKPAAVWLVERGEGFEQYSNGLRIETTYAIPGEPRSFRVFTREKGMDSELEDKPVGILFHTSESDIWPLEANYNEHLRDSSHHLLLYVRRLKCYNYVIDRFGRVFRVVEEASRANHAGRSVWEQDGRFYLSLNNAFLGVCFETRWEGGLALPITAAQLAAGRSLTESLRNRWKIAPEMCLTHGLASVNARKHLIGEHVDWARGFPFDAFGLPDQYSRPAPSVADFGFNYDDDFLKVLGEPWDGVRKAERSLASEAARQGKTVDEVRRERQGLFDRWLMEQTRDEEARASQRAEAPTRGPRGG